MRNKDVDFLKDSRPADFFSELVDFDIKNEEGYPDLELNEEALFEKLRNALPDEISSNAIWYIINCTKKRANAAFEHGQIFSYKTGKPTSIEFLGTETAIRFKTFGPKINLNYLSNDELNKFYSLPYNESFISYIGEDFLAIQHNHTKSGYNAPSAADFELLLSNGWIDYLFAISSKEIWMIESKGHSTMLEYVKISEKIREIEHGVDDMKKVGFSLNERQKYYSNEIINYINNCEFNVRAYRVVL